MPVYISKNNWIKHFLGKIRDRESSSSIFTSSLKKLSIILAAESHNEFSLSPKDIHTPLSKCKIYECVDSIVIVPILRSGLAMSEALQSFFENATVGHIGLYRDADLNAIKYYEKLPPNLEKSQIILCDPLIATGATLLKAIQILTKYNCKKIIILGVIISEHATQLLDKNYPNISVYVAEKDPDLNPQGYIIPGLGDAGDRLFGTK